MDPPRGTIDAPIDRHPKHEYRWAVVTDGKPSITHYETLEVFRHASLLEIHLETGRTHQIRVHTPRCATRAWATSPTVPTRSSPRAQGCTGSGCTRTGSRSTTRRPASGSRSSSPCPDDLPARPRRRQRDDLAVIAAP